DRVLQHGGARLRLLFTVADPDRPDRGGPGRGERCPMTARSEATVGEHCFAGLRALADALAGRELSSVEVVKGSLERIEATQSTLNTFRCVRHEAALAGAEEADRRLAAGERASLLGVPVAIKDDTDLAGETTPFGCVGEFEPKTQDSEVVRRLKAAGAVIVGKTTTPELGQWPLTEGAASGVTRNPWSLEH